MNVKRFWIAFVVVYILAQLTDILVHVVILGSTYESEGIKEIFRNMDEMNAKMWIMYVTDLVWVFFFTYIFVKGYENKGLLEGLKYGVYIGLFIPFVFAYQSYVIYPVPYSLAFQWFLYGVIQCIIYGIVVAAIYRPKEVTTSEA